MFKKKQLVVLLSIFALFWGCSKKEEKLMIFHAGSLSIPLQKMSEAFNEKYPQVKISREAAGSRTCARKISELNKKADIMFSADYTVIDQLLIPEFADWNIRFVTNEMAIMFAHNAKYAQEMTAENWAEILLREGVSYGHSDPNADPCGYRSQLVWQLAEKHYQQPELYHKLVEKEHIVRPKETDLIALLESGLLDYLFIYRSVAEQHGAEYLILPNEINLKTSELKDFYKQASIEISGKNPGETITKKGAPMVYGLTIPTNASNKKWAEKFVAFVLSEEGNKIMQENGQPAIVPAKISGETKSLPASIKKYVSK